MKRLIMIAAIMLAAQSGLFAQAQTKTDNSTWVIESNVKEPKKQVVKFYDADLKLIYEEKVEGKKLKIDKLKVRQMLDNSLAELLKNDTVVVQGVIANNQKRKAKL